MTSRTRTHPHRISDIAEQSGLSPATVDRVLHGRAGVSARAVRAVEQALLDLDRQQTQLRLGSRTLLLDVVMQAPGRFSTAVRDAVEAELPALRPAAVRARFHVRETGTPQDVVAALADVGQRGRTSHGVLLKAPDDPEVGRAVDALATRGIPVVTLVTDVRGCRRVAYVGLDNASAGATAAYLMARWLDGVPGSVLLTLSRSTFYGERERAEAFRAAIATQDPGRRLVEAADADGLDPGTAVVVRAALAEHADVVGVYSIGGGNGAIVDELERVAIAPRVHIGHDLDADNVDLLRQGRLACVLHHDLRSDVRAACRQVMRHHGLLPGAPTSVPAEVQVVTPHNIPARLRPR